MSAVRRELNIQWSGRLETERDGEWRTRIFFTEPEPEGELLWTLNLIATVVIIRN